MGNVMKQASTRFSIVKRSMGQSAVEKASYISRSLSGLKKMKYDKEHEHELVMYENTRADNRIDNRVRLSGWRKKFNVNFIVNTNIFLYN